MGGDEGGQDVVGVVEINDGSFVGKDDGTFVGKIVVFLQLTSQRGSHSNCLKG